MDINQQKQKLGYWGKIQKFIQDRNNNIMKMYTQKIKQNNNNKMGLNNH